MKIIYHGHSCFEFISGEVSVITDPFITFNKRAQH